MSAAAGVSSAGTPGCCSRAVGWVLACLSTLLFTSTIFCVKFWAINPVQLLLVRSLLQTVLTALILSKCLSCVDRYFLKKTSRYYKKDISPREKNG